MVNKNTRVFSKALSLAILLAVFSQYFQLAPLGNAVLGDNDKTNQDDLELIDWIVIHPIKGDNFPIGIFPYLDLDILVESSWGTVFTEFVKEDPRSRSWRVIQFIWIEVPKTNNGVGEVNITINSEFLGTYPISWNKFTPANENPSVITYTYNWFSWWVGETLLVADLRSDGSLNVSFEILKRRQSLALQPYNHSFAFELKNAISIESILNLVNTSNIETWETWTYSSEGSGADGGGFRQNAIIEWEDEWSVNINHIEDHDTGLGYKTQKNDVDIGRMLSALHGEMIRLIDRSIDHFGLYETQISEEPSTNIVVSQNTGVGTATPFPSITFLSILVAIPILRRKMKI